MGNMIGSNWTLLARDTLIRPRWRSRSRHVHYVGAKVVEVGLASAMTQLQSTVARVRYMQQNKSDPLHWRLSWCPDPMGYPTCRWRKQFFSEPYKNLYADQGSKYRISESYRMRVFHIEYWRSGEISGIHAQIGHSYWTLYIMKY